MSLSSFTDKSCRPKESLIDQELSSCLPLWQSLAGFIRSHHRTEEELKFRYGKSYGWAQRIKSRGVLLTAMFPNKGYFVTKIILNLEQLNQAETMKLHKNVVESLESANLYREGKWLFIRTESDEDVEDIQALLQLKLYPKRGAQVLTERDRANKSLQLTPKALCRTTGSISLELRVLGFGRRGN